MCYTGLASPVLGNVWSAVVDPSGHPGATFVGITGRSAPESGVFVSGGEALVDLTSQKLFQVLVGVGSDPITIAAPVPCDASLAGGVAYTQAYLLGGAGWELCNALDLTLGYY